MFHNFSAIRCWISHLRRKLCFSTCFFLAKLVNFLGYMLKFINSYLITSSRVDIFEPLKWEDQWSAGGNFFRGTTRDVSPPVCPMNEALAHSWSQSCNADAYLARWQGLATSVAEMRRHPKENRTGLFYLWWIVWYFILLFFVPSKRIC